MSWFAKKFMNWASKKHKQEMGVFIGGLSTADGDELGMMVAVATHVRHQLEAKGHAMLNPFVYINVEPMLPYFLSTAIKQKQKEGKFQEAAALMVWLHTFRAATNPLELRQLGRDMWRPLERGFQYVQEAKASYFSITGITLNIEGYNDFPEGLTPEPL